MKTSLIIDDRVYEEAKAESVKTGKSLSEIICFWASLGREELKNRNKTKLKKFTPVDLGEEKIDLSSRKEWMEELDDRS